MPKQVARIALHPKLSHTAPDLRAKGFEVDVLPLQEYNQVIGPNCFRIGEDGKYLPLALKDAKRNLKGATS